MGTDTDIVIPNGVTAIGARAFEDFQSPVAVRIPASVTDIDENALHRVWMVKVDDGNTEFSSYNGILYSKDRSKLLRCPQGRPGSIIIPNGVTMVGDYAFHSCDDLLEIYIPASVTSIGEFAFWGCSITGVMISEGVESIENATFAGCSSLTDVIIPDSIVKSLQLLQLRGTEAGKKP